MFLNKNQENLLVEIANHKGSGSITSLGKKVYNTYVSAFNNCEILKLYGYVEMHRNKNKVIVQLTDKGSRIVDLIISKRRIQMSE